MNARTSTHTHTHTRTEQIYRKRGRCGDGEERSMQIGREKDRENRPSILYR